MLSSILLMKKSFNIYKIGLEVFFMNVDFFLEMIWWILKVMDIFSSKPQQKYWINYVTIMKNSKDFNIIAQKYLKISQINSHWFHLKMPMELFIEIKVILDRIQILEIIH